MKNLLLLVVITACFAASSCNTKESERFRLLTTPTWVADSLLANGVDATGPTGILNIFVGDVKFNTDGTGYFGRFNGTWRFLTAETQLQIVADSLPIPITADIKELTTISLKLTTVFPNPQDLLHPYNIRMTFRVK